MTDEQRDRAEQSEGRVDPPIDHEVDSVQSPSDFLHNLQIDSAAMAVRQMFLDPAVGTVPNGLTYKTQDLEKSLWRGKPVSSMTRDELIVALHEMSDLYLDELKSRRWYGTLNCAGHHSPACRCIHCLEFE